MTLYQQGKKDELEALFSESVAIFESAPPDKKYGPEGWQTLQAKGNLGNVYVNEINRPADGDRVYAEVMASFEKLGQTDGAQYITAAANRAAARTSMAPPKYDDETERCGRIAFEWHSARKSNSLYLVAWNYHHGLMGRGKFAESAAMWGTVVSRADASVVAHRHLAEALIGLGRFDEAHRELVLAAGGDETKIDKGYEGIVQCRRANWATAEGLLRQAIETNGYRGFESSLFRSALGECLTKEGRFEEAQTELVRADEHLKRQVGSCWMTDESDRRLDALYAAWGRDRAVVEPPVRACIQAEQAPAKPKPEG